ncbi:MAG TPA: winged helix-turn-helix domain-containing protein [Azospirillum sp.]
MPKIGDRLLRNAATAILGREREMDVLLRCLDEDAPLVVHVHGLSGIGKTTLMRAFAARARDRGAVVIALDCGFVEPTPQGFTAALSKALAGDAAGDAVGDAGGVGAITGAMAGQAAGRGRLVLALDNYQALRLLDAWLRQEFLPTMPDGLRVVLAGRLPPVAHWLTAPEWQGLFRPLPLGPLDAEAARRLAVRAGARNEAVARIVAFAHGHPLALTLAAELAATGVPDLGTSLDAVLHHLSRLHLDGIEDAAVRGALRASCVVRRITRPLIEAMLPGVDGADLIDRIARLPFVEGDAGGLAMADTVREALAADFEACDPNGFRACRRAAWHHLSRAAAVVSESDLWRCTADLIYILRNPVVREAFFPNDAISLDVEPARPEHGDAVRAIARRHEPPEAARLIESWWSRAPQCFSVVLHEDGAVAGFYVLFDPARMPERLLLDDPVAEQWWRHLKENRIPSTQAALFLRRWLSEADGERPSPVQAAAWLDIKRHYLEMRPRLRRVYLGLADPAPYAKVAERLGFRLLPRHRARVGGATCETAMLDMGPASVEGWLSWLVAAELGIDRDEILDVPGRALRLAGGTVALTRLEFEVMRYLWLHRGAVVSRQELLDHVWGLSFDGGSNVVDTVIAGLRRKLGPQAEVIGTQRGHGYVCRMEGVGAQVS